MCPRDEEERGEGERGRGGEGRGERERERERERVEIEMEKGLYIINELFLFYSFVIGSCILLVVFFYVLLVFKGI